MCADSCQSLEDFFNIRYIFFCNLAHAENGADIDLQTTEAGRTVFHMVLAAEVTDKRLIERMVERGALVRREKLVLVENFHLYSYVDVCFFLFVRKISPNGLKHRSYFL